MALREPVEKGDFTGLLDRSLFYKPVCPLILKKKTDVNMQGLTNVKKKMKLIH